MFVVARLLSIYAVGAHVEDLEPDSRACVPWSCTDAREVGSVRLGDEERPLTVWALGWRMC